MGLDRQRCLEDVIKNNRTICEPEITELMYNRILDRHVARDMLTVCHTRVYNLHREYNTRQYVRQVGLKCSCS